MSTKKCADGVAIHIWDNTLFSKQWQTALDMPTQSPMLIAKAAFALFEKKIRLEEPNSLSHDSGNQLGATGHDAPTSRFVYEHRKRLRKQKGSTGVLKPFASGSARTASATAFFFKISGCRVKSLRLLCRPGCFLRRSV